MGRRHSVDLHCAVEKEEKSQVDRGNGLRFEVLPSLQIDKPSDDIGRGSVTSRLVRG